MPQAGEVYHYPAYVFPDGEQDDKFVILLGQIPGNDWILGRTTSRQHGRPVTPPCNQSNAYPSFYVGALQGVFHCPTWLALDRLDDHDQSDLAAKIQNGAVELIGSLPLALLCAALSCARGADDTTQLQAQAMSDLRAALGCE
jgi:hypothetical protein